MKNKIRALIKEDKKDFVKFLILFLVVVAFICVTIWLLPWIISLKDAAGRAAFEEYIHSMGPKGLLILFGVQVMQVVIAIIPGEPIEVIAGLLYGTWGGYLICTIGMLAGTALIFYAVKFLGASFIQKLIGGSKLEKFKFLNDTRRLEIVTFLLFFIPGTPKDMLTYFMPFTKIKPIVFFALVTIARIPSIVSSTYAGASIGDGKWLQTALIFAGIGVVAIIGLVINDKLFKRIKKDEKDEKDKKDKIK